MLWVLIRSASETYAVCTQLEVPYSSNEYPQHMFSWRDKKNMNTFWLKKKTSSLSKAMKKTQTSLQSYNLVKTSGRRTLSHRARPSMWADRPGLSYKGAFP